MTENQLPDPTRAPGSGKGPVLSGCVKVLPTYPWAPRRNGSFNRFWIADGHAKVTLARTRLMINSQIANILATGSRQSRVSALDTI